MYTLQSNTQAGGLEAETQSGTTAREAKSNSTTEALAVAFKAVNYFPSGDNDG